jgi:hypothetical protein
MVTPSFFLPDSVTSSSSTMPVTGRERELIVPAPSVPVVSGEICCRLVYLRADGWAGCRLQQTSFAATCSRSLLQVWWTCVRREGWRVGARR